jgi:hypothetical protein
MVQSKRTERPTAFSEAADFLGDQIQKARAAKQVEIKNTKTGTCVRYHSSRAAEFG